jgi:hypothetical protein
MEAEGTLVDECIELPYPPSSPELRAHLLSLGVTMPDQSIEFQQHLATMPIAVVVLIADSNRLESLKPLVPDA